MKARNSQQERGPSLNKRQSEVDTTGIILLTISSFPLAYHLRGDFDTGRKMGPVFARLQPPFGRNRYKIQKVWGGGVKRQEMSPPRRKTKTIPRTAKPSWCSKQTTGAGTDLLANSQALLWTDKPLHQLVGGAPSWVSSIPTAGV